MAAPAGDKPDFSTRAAEARAFIKALYPPETPGLLEIRARRGSFGVFQDWYPLDSLPRFEPLLRRLDDWDVWFGLALRASAGSGARANCLSLHSVHLDADPKTREEAEQLVHKVKAFPLVPSIIVRSGGALRYHVYWKLDQPLIVRDASGAILPAVEEHYRRVIAGLAQHFGADASVSDLPRVLRLPGSRNVKRENGGSLVRLVQLHPERAYPLGAFDPWLSAEKEPEPPRAPREARDPDDPDSVNVLEEFASRGWVIEDQGNGLYFVRCPWAESHSQDSGPSATAIWEPSDPSLGWAFKCFHSHCTQRRSPQMYEFFRLMRLADVLAGGPR